MTESVEKVGRAEVPTNHREEANRRYVGFFHELDAWTEYWDLYHPESHGHFYFGDEADEPGLLRLLLPRDRRPAVFVAWTRMALGQASAEAFAHEVRDPNVSAAVVEVDALLARVFANHFRDAGDPTTQADYLEGMFRFATNSLPPATQRYALVPEGDPRKSTAGRHTLAGDLMWFAWSLILEAAHLIMGPDDEHARRCLMLAGVATGCPADFAWNGHRRTRPEYQSTALTAALLQTRGRDWVLAFDAAAQEVHALFRIREWGSDE